MRVTGVVLAAGSSRRLGAPKQLLPFRGTSLLDATLAVARQCVLDQLIVTLGGAAEQVAAAVDLSGVDVVRNPTFTTGCGSSIRVALDAVDARSAGVVLLLGDQPGTAPDTVHRLVGQAAGSTLGICRYSDGLGHPIWLGRDSFDDLRALPGDKAVWKLLESGRHAVTEIVVDGPVPLDVDTWEDYRALLAQESAGPAIGALP